jgi:hypothetical protein
MHILILQCWLKNILSTFALKFKISSFYLQRTEWICALVPHKGYLFIITSFSVWTHTVRTITSQNQHLSIIYNFPSLTNCTLFNFWIWLHYIQKSPSLIDNYHSHFNTKMYNCLMLPLSHVTCTATISYTFCTSFSKCDPQNPKRK